jgi:hypothetical protein
MFDNPHLGDKEVECYLLSSISNHRSARTTRRSVSLPLRALDVPCQLAVVQGTELAYLLIFGEKT